jgi:hypothetical protein
MADMLKKSENFVTDYNRTLCSKDAERKLKEAVRSVLPSLLDLQKPKVDEAVTDVMNAGNAVFDGLTAQQAEHYTPQLEASVHRALERYTAIVAFIGTKEGQELSEQLHLLSLPACFLAARDSTGFAMPEMALFARALLAGLA